ncbi:hypothetical protein FRC06_006381 [Ceratobasidium sp. 370]|nr:hypothetical protein FRC06_006381 [Ceratobasidium sp. 370]
MVEVEGLLGIRDPAVAHPGDELEVVLLLWSDHPEVVGELAKPDSVELSFIRTSILGSDALVPTRRVRKNRQVWPQEHVAGRVWDDEGGEKIGYIDDAASMPILHRDNREKEEQLPSPTLSTEDVKRGGRWSCREAAWICTPIEYLVHVLIRHPNYNHVSPPAPGIEGKVPVWVVTGPRVVVPLNAKSQSFLKVAGKQRDKLRPEWDDMLAAQGYRMHDQSRAMLAIRFDPYPPSQPPPLFVHAWLNDMSHIWERQEVHKSSKCIEIVVTLFADYCQAVTSMANLQKKLGRALKVEKDKTRSGSPRKEFNYNPSIASSSLASTNVTGTTATTDSQSTPLMSPFPLTPIPGLGPNGYFGQDDGVLKPPLPPFARHSGSPSPSQSPGAASPPLASPAPIGTSLASPTPPPIIQRKESAQFPPPPQHPASPTRPHVGLPPPSPVRSNVGLPGDNHDGLPPSTPTRPFVTLPGSYEVPPPVRALPSPVRAPPSPVRTPLPAARTAEVAPTPPTPSTKPNTGAEQATPTPARTAGENGGWDVGSWAPSNGEQEEQVNAEPPVFISRFLSENKEMGLDLPGIKGIAVRESMEKLVAAAREASEGSGKSPSDGANWWGGSQFETGPTGTVKVRR